jgi:hypothetical protein
MQYAERLPNSRTLLAPVLALAVGAAAATGAYALLDTETVVVGDPEVIVAEVPAPGTVAQTKNEAATAAAITASPTVAETKNEAATAAAITASPTVAETKNEAATAAAITASPTVPARAGHPSHGGTDEAATAAAIAPPPESAP